MIMRYLFFLLFSFTCTFSASAQICSDFIEQNAFSARYEIGSDPSTVIDLATGLRWQRCSVGLVFNDNNGSADIATHSCNTANNKQSWNWNEAIERAAQEGSGWRLPNIKELGTLAELGCNSPAINSEVFPNTVQSSGYWSNTPNATMDSSAWSVEFDNGSKLVTDKRSSLPIRLVNDQ